MSCQKFARVVIWKWLHTLGKIAHEGKQWALLVSKTRHSLSIVQYVCLLPGHVPWEPKKWSQRWALLLTIDYREVNQIKSHFYTALGTGHLALGTWHLALGTLLKDFSIVLFFKYRHSFFETLEKQPCIGENRVVRELCILFYINNFYFLAL